MFELAEAALSVPFQRPSESGCLDQSGPILPNASLSSGSNALELHVGSLFASPSGRAAWPILPCSHDIVA